MYFAAFRAHDGFFFGQDFCYFFLSDEFHAVFVEEIGAREVYIIGAFVSADEVVEHAARVRRVVFGYDGYFVVRAQRAYFARGGYSGGGASDYEMFHASAPPLRVWPLSDTL